MFTDSASIIMFAIRSAVKLGHQTRKAYVDSTRRRALVLPMPNFFSSSGYKDALNYFKSPDFGKRYVDGYTMDGQDYEGSKDLQRLVNTHLNSLSDKDKKELEAFHEKCVNIDRARDGELEWEDDIEINAEEFEAIFTVGQWRSGADPTPSTLHRMAGTIIEIGIDYALNSPDLFDKNSKKGKAVHSFLSALDSIDIPETDLSELPARFFVAAMETASETPELVSGHPDIVGVRGVGEQCVEVEWASRDVCVGRHELPRVATVIGTVKTLLRLGIDESVDPVRVGLAQSGATAAPPV